MNLNRSSTYFRDAGPKKATTYSVHNSRSCSDTRVILQDIELAIEVLMTQTFLRLEDVCLGNTYIDDLRCSVEAHPLETARDSCDVRWNLKRACWHIRNQGRFIVAIITA